MDFKEQAIARVQITAVMHRYASLARENCDWAELAKLLAPGAIYRIGGGVEVGAGDMKEVIRGKEAKYIRHHITTIDIEFTSGVEAHSRAQFFAATNYLFNDHWGHWKDTWRKQSDGSWLIQDRTIVTEGMAPGGWCDKVWGEEALSASKAENP
ncbi:uncharacterized protein BP5553_01296 [Venustampulla echinocandica]|uniref:SnoaL-like domain-containing protein n=1 Tax=Venustampulla echinocandica TaxID=2656787 RepID=A0A370U0M2_9HELO|nr:uncharacterized protein BP5553_01296 [Venustampulla echinocandica]RDL41317.1 hypothetical protein BP5553_01296 [Venustampulla echinocandica]